MFFCEQTTLCCLMLLFPFCSLCQEPLVLTYDENDSTLELRWYSNYAICVKNNDVPEEFYTKFGEKGSPVPGYESLFYSPGNKKETLKTIFDSAAYAALDVRKLDVNTGGLGSSVGKRIVLTRKTEVSTHTKNQTTEHNNLGREFVSMNNLIPIMAIVAILLIIVIVVIVVIHKKGRKIKSKSFEKEAEDLGLEVVEVVSSELKRGLDHIHGDEASYYTMNIAADYKDTAVSKIYLHHTAVKKMYDFFKEALESSEQTMETGCYFVGCWEKDCSGRYDISVEDIVKPGTDIEPGEFSFNFGKEIGLNLYNIISEKTKKSGRDIVHTVWMHSHPGLGLFLSSHDLLVQKQLTYSDEPNRLAAFVIDTNTPDWQFAVFTAKTSGTMNNKEDNPRIYSLDELYEWSRSTHQRNGDEAPDMSVIEVGNKENYHAIQINHQGESKTINIYFSGKTINQIDDILYKTAGEQTLGGWLVGKSDKKGNLTVDSCEAGIAPDSIGVLVVDSYSTCEEIVTKYGELSDIMSIMVCRGNDELWILTRQDKDSKFDANTDMTVTSLRPMKEWLRRRRIYK